MARRHDLYNKDALRLAKIALGPGMWSLFVNVPHVFEIKLHLMGFYI